MAKKRPQDRANTQQNKGSDGESIQGYFRRVFQENPGLPRSRSNEDLLNRWLADHPRETAVPRAVKVGLQNVKSLLRSKGRKRRALRAAAAAAAAPPGTPAPRRPAARRSGLEVLEEQIDECLAAARTLDREGLEDVISLLHRARNEVVWKMGQ
jgi:hypothetical protein